MMYYAIVMTIHTLQLCLLIIKQKISKKGAETSTLFYRFANRLVGDGQSPYPVLVLYGHKSGP